eukprot:1341453-Amorphochlora_amoeboformis.AAC.1
MIAKYSLPQLSLSHAFFSHKNYRNTILPARIHPRSRNRLTSRWLRVGGLEAETPRWLHPVRVKVRPFPPIYEHDTSAASILVDPGWGLLLQVLASAAMGLAF